MAPSFGFAVVAIRRGTDEPCLAGMTKVDVDILIVGAGLAGAATGYHLGRRANRGVLIVEREPLPGMHSSGRNAAIVREHGVDEVLTPLMSEGCAVLRRGELARFERRGLMLLGIGDRDVRAHFPPARGAGRWCPDDGTVDVAGLLQRYLAELDVQYNTEVTCWVRDGARLRVTTNRGEIDCGLLVNGAGPWAGVLGNLPLTPMNRHLFTTPPMDWVDRDWPCVWDTQVGLYFRPESGGLLLSGCDETPAEPGDYREDSDELERLAEKLSASQPGLCDLSLRSTWVGQRVFAADRRFVIGFDPRDDCVFHVAGLGGHGVAASYSVGRLAAETILGERSRAGKPFSAARLLKPDLSQNPRR